MKFEIWAGRVICLAALLSPAAKTLADSGNPFENTTTLANDWTGYAKTAAIAFASLAGVVVITIAMFGVLRIRWAIQIIGALIALAGLPWLVAAAQGNH